MTKSVQNTCETEIHHLVDRLIADPSNSEFVKNAIVAKIAEASNATPRHRSFMEDDQEDLWENLPV